MRAILHAFSTARMGVALLALIGVYTAVGTVPLDLLGFGVPRGTRLWMLPSLELSPSAYFEAWPLRVLLWGFIACMILATLRRIELRLENAGVLLVHAGIVCISAGGAVYWAQRWEATLVLAAPLPGANAGPSARACWDRWDTRLLIERTGLQGQPPAATALLGLPRWNDYNTPWSPRPMTAAPRAESAAAPSAVRIISYAAYATLDHAWREASPTEPGATPAWIIRVVAGGPGARIDTGDVLFPLDPSRPPLVIPGVALVSSADAPDAELPRIVLSRSAVTIQQGGALRTIDDIRPGGRLRLADNVELVLGRFVPAAVREPRPAPVPLDERRPDLIGTHAHALIHVEAAREGEAPAHAWIPLGLDADPATAVGGWLVSWRPVERSLEGWRVALTRFRPVLDARTGAFADFHADLRIERDGEAPRELHVALNKPISLPVCANRGGIDGLLDRLLPTRLTVAHASWDQEGWAQAQRDDPEAGAGPRFVALSVASVRGTELIAIGAVAFALGTPWAFYIKPWLVRRRAAVVHVGNGAEAEGGSA